MLKDSQDAFGHMVDNYMKGIRVAYVIKRNDSLVAVDFADVYFNSFDDWPEAVRRAMAGNEVSGLRR